MAQQTRAAQGEKKAEGEGLVRHREYWPDLFRLSPFGLMRRFVDEMDRPFGVWPRAFAEEASGWWPATDIAEQDGKMVVNVDLPGMKPEDVKLEVTRESLVISGERKQEREEKGEGFHRSERHYGRFYRQIPLPEGAETDKAEARFTNGELRVTIPVPQVAHERRQIPIRT